MDPFDYLVSEDLTTKSREELERIFLKREDGRILFLGRVPVASLYATFLAGIYAELIKIVGRAAKGLILTASRNGGYRAGSAIRRRYQKRFGELTREKIIQIAKNMITVWDKCFGWGKFEFEFDERNKKIVVKVWESFEANGYVKLKKEKSDVPVCWMLLGYIWGLFEGLFDCKMSGEEKMCIAKGDEYCLFEYDACE